MTVDQNKAVIPLYSSRQNRCLSCGTTENMRQRKYCSIKCRQNLRQKLNTRCGLLQVLNAHYATFYFSETAIIMDILPYGYKEIFRYTRMRTSGLKPADDFSKMTNVLGDVWWKEKERTNRQYLASRRVLDMAARHLIPVTSMRPKLVKNPNVKTESLNYLAISKHDLRSADLHKLIKNAYRRQAKIHHPDSGGHAGNFRKLHSAYKELLHWADHPSFVSRRGFSDRWFYDGENKKWVQPMSARE